MTTFVRCQHLQEHDDFDVGYDKTFNDRSYHHCLFLKRDVIPHDECKVTCRGYSPEDTTQSNGVWSAISPERQAARKNSGITHEAMRQGIMRAVEKINAVVPSESEMIEAQSRLAAQQTQQPILDELRSHQTSLQRQIQKDAAALRTYQYPIAREAVAIAKTSWPLRKILNFLANYGKPSLILSPIEKNAKKLRKNLELCLLSWPLEELVTEYSSLTGKPLERHPLHKSIIQLDAKLKLAKDELRATNLQLEEVSVALTNAERAYAELLQRQEKYEALERVRVLLNNRLLPALESCGDPLEDEDVSDIQRFLDDARLALVSPPPEFEKIISRLQGMRLP